MPSYEIIPKDLLYITILSAENVILRKFITLFGRQSTFHKI